MAILCQLKKTRQSRRHICLVFGIFVRYLQRFHRMDHAAHRHEYVLVDELDEATFVVVRVATAVDDSHLLYERTLTGFAGTYAQVHWP